MANKDENLNVKLEPSTKEALQRVAEELYPDVPGNMSVAARRFIKEGIETHDQQAKRKK
jgi:hypothetical protein